MSPLRYPSEAVDAAPLAAPLTFPFSGRSAQNRFLKAAMTESLSSYTPENHATHGIPSPELATLYERWGVDGQYGQILTGNIMLFDNQLEGPGNMVIPLDAEYEGEKFEAFKEVAAGAKKGGSLIVGQLSHPGRQVEARVNPNPIGASDIPLSGK
jgi:2,4-dienoyl-CoA reductase-like NADH-dependent reductase (Old Yellow Enzyme family)